MPSWKSTAWGVLFIILIASVPTSHVFRLIDWFSRLLSSLSSPSSIMNINHLLMSYLHLFDKNWPTCIWRRVLQDLQRALQHDGAFPQRAHKEQYHLPWVSLDKAFNYKIWSPDKALTKSWQNMIPLFEQERLVRLTQGGRARDSAKWPGVRLSQVLMKTIIFDKWKCWWYHCLMYKCWLKLEFRGFGDLDNTAAVATAKQLDEHYK